MTFDGHSYAFLSQDDHWIVHHIIYTLEKYSPFYVYFDGLWVQNLQQTMQNIYHIAMALDQCVFPHGCVIDFLHKTFYRNVDRERWVENVLVGGYATFPFVGRIYRILRK